MQALENASTAHLLDGLLKTGDNLVPIASKADEKVKLLILLCKSKEIFLSDSSELNLPKENCSFIKEIILLADSILLEPSRWILGIILKNDDCLVNFLVYLYN